MQTFEINKVTIESSKGGTHWYIKRDGVFIEGFVKRGHGAATLKQVERVAAFYQKLATK